MKIETVTRGPLGPGHEVTMEDTRLLTEVKITNNSGNTVMVTTKEHHRGYNIYIKKVVEAPSEVE